MSAVSVNDKVDMRKDSIYKLFFYFFIPNLCAMLALSTYSTIDGIFVGKKLGENALAAIGLCWPVFPALIAFELLFGLGAASIASYFLGKGQDNRARLMFSSVFYFATLFSVIIGVILFFCVEKVALALGANELVLPYVVEYLQVIFLSAVIMVLHPLLDIFVINDKRPILAMMAMIIGSASNIVLNYIFLFVLELGMFGSALATAMGHGLGMMILLSHFVRKIGRIYFVWRFSLNAVFASAKNGVPQSISELSVAFVMIMFNHTLKTLADSEEMKVSYLAIYSIVMYVGVVCFTILLSCAQGVQPVASYNYGAGEMKRVRGIYAFGVGFATALGILVYAVFMSIDSMLVKLFLKSGQEMILEPTLEAMKVYFIGYIFLGFNIVSAIFFQSIQRPKSSFLITLSYNLIFVSILLFVLSYYYGVFGVWFSYPLSLVCSSVVVIGVIMYEYRYGVLGKKAL
ncbi:MATE family efflux transporter [Helicobacter sp. MIT 03-1614]|uniref:MATE family efflux transporter n=1 Tax=Helicobacter sp. MIT 03-1614 TaxID=1548147 RepID=UPI000513643A|nr:MATE family efflux transporter [Helicobacter sp. MIT 03-1614]TLD87716.1 MATE family efflux transporter [Helicobacter sp. MIT 03-1614]